MCFFVRCEPDGSHSPIDMDVTIQEKIKSLERQGAPPEGLAKIISALEEGNIEKAEDYIRIQQKVINKLNPHIYAPKVMLKLTTLNRERINSGENGRLKEIEKEMSIYLREVLKDKLYRYLGMTRNNFYSEIGLSPKDVEEIISNSNGSINQINPKKKGGKSFSPIK